MIRSSTFRSVHLFLTVVLLLGLAACKQREVYKCPEVVGFTDTFTQDTLYIDRSANELTFKAVYHKYPAEKGSWHGIVHREGQNGSPEKTPFSTGVTPWQFYCAVRELGGVDLNAVSRANAGEENVYTKGSVCEFYITWNGAAKNYEWMEVFQEIIPPGSKVQEKRGFEVRFGGNRTTHDEGKSPGDITGCVLCVYSCPSPPFSNAKLNAALTYKDDSEGIGWRTFRYRANPDVAPPDGTECTITIKVIKDSE